MLYYSATDPEHHAGVTPEAINGYQLLTSGNSGTIYAITTILFCDYSPTLSVSSKGTTASTGIVWAIEHQNSNNPSKDDCNGTVSNAALHAFNATNMARLYNSRGITTVNRLRHAVFDTHNLQWPGVYRNTNETGCVRAVQQPASGLFVIAERD